MTFTPLYHATLTSTSDLFIYLSYSLTFLLFYQLKQFPKTPIIGGKDCDAVTKTPPENEKFKIGSSISVTPMYTPCHTQDSICYFMEDDNTGEQAVFTGDTLFIGGM